MWLRVKSTPERPQPGGVGTSLSRHWMQNALLATTLQAGKRLEAAAARGAQTALTRHSAEEAGKQAMLCLCSRPQGRSLP